MAIRWAVTGGTWSSTSTWNGGATLGIPTVGDDVWTNGFTVTVDTGFTVNSLNNSARARDIATPAMTSNNSPSPYVAAASSVNTVSTDAWRAFDRDNNVSWTTLHTVALPSAIAANSTYSIASIGNTTAYRYYRINITLNGGQGTIVIPEIELYQPGTITLSAGGNFNFNTSNVTANLTGGLNLTSLVVNSVGGGTITINAPTSYIPSAVNGLLHSGTSNLIVNTLGNVLLGINSGAQIVHTSTGNLTLSGTLYQHQTFSAGGTNQTINSSGTGNIIINGSLEGQISGRGGETLILKSSSGIISISGNVSCRGNITINSTTITQLIIGGNLTNSSTSGNAQIIVGSPTVTVGGNVSNGAAALFQSTGGVLNVGGNVTNTSTTNNTIATNFTRINISGNVSGGTVNTISSSIATIINIDGSAFATSTGSAIFLSNSTSQVYLKGNIFNVNGKMAIHSPIVWLDQTGTTQARFFTSGGADRTLYSDNTFPNQPSTSDVRNLIKFGPSSGLTGTLIMASPTDVRSGVNTDNTVGTALLDTSQLLAELNASSDPIAQRLRKVATPEILGQLLAAYKK